MGTDLVHGGGAEADFVVAGRKVPADGRQQERTTDGRPRHSPHGHLVDRDLHGDALGDPDDRTVVFEAAEQGGVRPPCRSGH